MRRQDIQVGREYLTRDVKYASVFGVDFTRGLVRVEERGPEGKYFRVTWLMRDGSVRTTPRTLPKWLSPRRFMVEVPRS